MIFVVSIMVGLQCSVSFYCIAKWPNHTHTHTHTRIYTLLSSHYSPSCSIISNSTSLCYIAGSHCLSTPHAIVCIFFKFIFFPLYSKGIKLSLHVDFFSPPFVLLQYEYLDIVLNATQQDLLVNPFEVVSDNPKLPIPRTPSLSRRAATSLLSKSMIFFSLEMFICAGY